MKSSAEWSKEIIKYLRENPVESRAGARLQIQNIVEWIQQDAVANVDAPPGEIRIN